MPQQTRMLIYRDIVLECQHCYMICRYADADVRHSCPSCGRNIANWTALTEAVRQDVLKPPQDTPPCPSSKRGMQERD